MQFSSRRTTAASLLLCWLSVAAVDAFLMDSLSSSRMMVRTSTRLFSSVQQQKTDDTEQMRQDIDKMKREALRRLEALHTKMDEVKGEKAAQAAREFRERQSLDSMEGMAKAMTTTSTESKTESKQKAAKEGEEKTTAERMQQLQRPTQVNLLDNTQWKIVFNIGREQGTWMPAAWGHSGDRLQFQVVVDFTDEPIQARSKQDDEFLWSHHGRGHHRPHSGETTVPSKVVSGGEIEGLQKPSPAKLLKIVDAFSYPTGVGAASVGRQPLNIASTGAYRVLPGQGPMGTDIVRFYIELNENVVKKQGKKVTDVYCPKGRVYGTAGYFDQSLTTVSDKEERHKLRDTLQQEHHALVMQCQQLQMQLDNDERLFSWDRLSLMKDLHDLKQETDKAKHALEQARQRDPEKSQLRFSPDRNVALSKQGGVCCKVQKSPFALEYHILGRLELGCMLHPHHPNDDKNDDENDFHEDFEDLVKRLHP